MHLLSALVAAATFVAVAAAVYVVGASLLAVWPMWAMMGPGPGWPVALVLLGLAALAVGLIAPARRRAGSAGGANAERCPRCRAAVEPDYVLCPECHTALRAPCPTCQRSLKISWSQCPYCTSSAGQPGSAADSVGEQAPEEVPARGAR